MARRKTTVKEQPEQAPLSPKERDEAVAARKAEEAAKSKAAIDEIEERTGKRVDPRTAAKQQSQRNAIAQADIDARRMPDPLPDEMPPMVPGKQMTLHELNMRAQIANRDARNEADEIGKVAGRAARDAALGSRRVIGHRGQHHKMAMAMAAAKGRETNAE